jgi:hypothetical protein
MHQNSLRDWNPESRQTISTPPPCLRQCAHIHLPSTSPSRSLLVTSHNLSFHGKDALLVIHACPGPQSSQRLPRPAGTSIAFILDPPAPAPRRSPQTKAPAFRPPVLAGMSVQLAVRMRSGEGCLEEKVVITCNAAAPSLRDVAETQAGLAGPGSWRKRHTEKCGQHIGGCRLWEVRRWCCGCLGDADEANRIHEIATLTRSYLLWGCFGGVIVRMVHYGVLREAE